MAVTGEVDKTGKTDQAGKENKVIKIGFLGLGTVGRGAYRLLTRSPETLTRRCGAVLAPTRALVRDLSKDRGEVLPAGFLTTDPAAVVEDPEIDVVIEAMGGTTTALDYSLRALRAGKSVVSANKDLLAEHGQELFTAAEAGGTDLLFEASVGGGIPIIRPLKQCLVGNHIVEVMGIVNGTTNYILTKMNAGNGGFDAALAEAQRLGYAEADPSSDVDGLDAARKVAILASVAFTSRVTFGHVYREGIAGVTAEDVKYARELGGTIKLLAIAREVDGAVEVRVHPAIIPQTHPLAGVGGVFNAIFVKGDAVGDLMFYGRGAGELPTGSAVVGDVVEVARRLVSRNGADHTGLSCTCYDEKPLRPMSDVHTQFYVRMVVADKPGVLAAIASIFGGQGVSIASVIQKRKLDSDAELVVVTHRVREGDAQEAIRRLRRLPAVTEVASVIRVEGFAAD